MFEFRSREKELLDAEDIPEQDLFRNLRELDFINHWLGGYQISFSALKKVLQTGEKYVLVDIGSGGGDTLKRISKWKKNRNYNIDLFGVDIKPVCVSYALTNNPDADIRFICDDYKKVFEHVPETNILHACLFCHHLNNDELINLVRFAGDNNAILVINDLERNALAYYLIKILTAIFSQSYLVKHDAPMSVSRGFKRKEWLAILKQAGAGKYSVSNKWAFRHEVIVYPSN